MRLPGSHTPLFRPVTWAVVALGVVLLTLHLWPPGHAAAPSAPPVAPPHTHRTPTPSPTTTVTPTVSSGVDPFGFLDYGTQFASYLPDLCPGVSAAAGQERWVISRQEFYPHDPLPQEPLANTLAIQRCVGRLQIGDILLPRRPVLELAATPTPTPPVRAIVPLLPTVAVDIPSLRPQVVEALEIAPLQVTPTPGRLPPLLNPPLPTRPWEIVIPTLEATPDFTGMPVVNLTLYPPTGGAIQLESAPLRPDLWIHDFSSASPVGTYTLEIESGGEVETHQIVVHGPPQVFFSDRQTGMQTSTFVRASSAVINFTDFRPDHSVSADVYQLKPAFGSEQNALALVDSWTFTMDEDRRRAPLSERLADLNAPPFGTFVVLACYTVECDRLPAVAVAFSGASGMASVTWPYLASTAAYVEPSAAALDVPATAETIRFDPGATETTIGLELSETGVEAYRLGILADQVMTVEVDSPNVQGYVLSPGGDLVKPVAEYPGVWQFQIEETGQHTILLYGDEDAHLTISIPPLGESSLPPPEDESPAQPAVRVLRPACGRTVNVEAGAPVELHYGIWAGRGVERAARNQEYVQIQLTIDGQTIEGRRILPPVATLDEAICGRDYEDSYWIYHVAELGGLSPGTHDVRVTFRFSRPVEDGYGDVYTNPFTQQFTIVAQ